MNECSLVSYLGHPLFEGGVLPLSKEYSVQKDIESGSIFLITTESSRQSLQHLDTIYQPLRSGNAISLVQDLNSCHRVHFLRR